MRKSKKKQTKKANNSATNGKESAVKSGGLEELRNENQILRTQIADLEAERRLFAADKSSAQVQELEEDLQLAHLQIAQLQEELEVYYSRYQEALKNGGSNVARQTFGATMLTGTGNATASLPFHPKLLRIAREIMAAET